MTLHQIPAKALCVQANHISFPGVRLDKFFQDTANRYAKGNEIIFAHVNISFEHPQGDRRNVTRVRKPFSK